MKQTHWLGLILLGGAFLACQTSTAASDPTAMDAASPGGGDDVASAELREHHRHHNHGGVAQFIAMSLDTLGTDETKRPQIENLQEALHKCMAPAHALEKALLSTLADGVAAGTVDATKVDASIGQIELAAASAHACSLDTLNQLHAILSPVERETLADKVRAHWAVWRKMNHDEEVGGKEHGGRLEALAAELALTPEQVEQISSALHTAHDRVAGKFDKAKAEAHVTTFATAFASDTFDAKTIITNANGHLAAHGSRCMARFYEVVTPLLTTDQRTKLAEHLRAHASHQPTIASN